MRRRSALSKEGLAAIALLCLSCAAQHPPPPQARRAQRASSEAPSSPAPPPRSLPPPPAPPVLPPAPTPLTVEGLSAEEPFLALPIEGRGDAVVAVPLGATGPKPVVVATHGAGGSPETHCRYWREILGASAFILCPRGIRLDTRESRYFYDGHFELAREVEAALDALALRFPEHADPAKAVYLGYSQGATMGALMLPLLRGRFARAALVEGGFDEWNLRVARIYREQGGERVLFVCGRPVCAKGAQLSARYLAQEGVASRARSATSAGHTYRSAVEAVIRREIPWLLEGDARFGSLAEPPPPAQNSPIEK